MDQSKFRLHEPWVTSPLKPDEAQQKHFSTWVELKDKRCYAGAVAEVVTTTGRCFRSKVADFLDNDHEDKLFIQAINSVGRGMGLKTIAEFVENERIYETLRYIGIDYAQGYAIGRPLSSPEFHSFNGEQNQLGNNVKAPNR